jgi:glucosamine--fructose-6-phosphate aminotransferase (isomerizing)
MTGLTTPPFETPPFDITPFERDIAEQPEALRRLAEGTLPQFQAISGRSWSRIVLTGMGSSHFAAVPTWRHLIALGHQAWAVDTGQLLDDERLVTPDTLLIATSQSGASGELTELLDRRRAGRIAPAALVGITDDTTSPLAGAADVLLPLHSGPEATVSTKSYLNTLAMHRMLRATFAGDPVEPIQRGELRAVATAVQAVLDDPQPRAQLAEAARATAHHPSRRLSYIGSRDTAATALFAALITKESAKVAAEGYVGGQFRHGPFELAGDGHTAVLFLPENDAADAAGPAGPAAESLRRLATDLVRSGSRVIVIGGSGNAETEAAEATEATMTLPIVQPSALAGMAAGVVMAELFAVELARANGVVPGAFIHGSKITTTI